ncbi:MAG: hypothetical protein U0Q16_02570 [Bryobacteraceae bacterium]
MAVLLRFLVEQELNGQGHSLKEAVLGTEVFGRPPGYNPKLDPVVRVEVRRLRLKLHEYYAQADAAGSKDGGGVRFEIPKGTYRPLVHWRDPNPDGSNDKVSGVAPPLPVAERRWRWSWSWAAMALTLALAVTAWIAWFGSREWRLPEGAEPRMLTDGIGFSRSPRYSPDGQSIAYSLERAGAKSRIVIRRIRGSQPEFFTSGERNDSEPAWSPDGGSIAFLRDKGEGRYDLTVKELASGRETVAGVVSERSSIDWTADGSAILASSAVSYPGRIVRFPRQQASGVPMPLAMPGDAKSSDVHPRASPDGKWIAFARSTETSVQDVFVAPVAGGSASQVTSVGRTVGGLAWTRDSQSLVVSLAVSGSLFSLWRVPIGRNGGTGGKPVRIAEAGVNATNPTLNSRSGGLAYSVRTADTNVWEAQLNPAKPPRALTASFFLDTSPQYSPDGSKLAYRSQGGGSDEIWVKESGDAAARQLTSARGPTTGSPRWSPDGRHIAFDSRSGRFAQIFVISIEGGTPTAVTRESSNCVVPSFSRDGRWIYFASDRSGDWDVWRITADGSGEPVRMTRDGGFAAFESYDGKWLYYSRRSKGGGIWRMPLPGGGPPTLVAKELEPRWWGHWGIGQRSLFFTVYDKGSERHSILSRDLVSGDSTRELVRFENMPVQFDNGLTVTAAEDRVAWAQLDHAGSDIYVIDAQGR